MEVPGCLGTKEDRTERPGELAVQVELQIPGNLFGIWDHFQVRRLKSLDSPGNHRKSLFKFMKKNSLNRAEIPDFLGFLQQLPIPEDLPGWDVASLRARRPGRPGRSSRGGRAHARANGAWAMSFRTVDLQGLVSMSQCFTSPKYWGYHFQQTFEGDVQNPQNGTFTNPRLTGAKRRE